MYQFNSMKLPDTNLVNVTEKMFGTNNETFKQAYEKEQSQMGLLRSTGTDRLKESVRKTHSASYHDQTFTFLVNYFFNYGGNTILLISPRQIASYTGSQPEDYPNIGRIVDVNIEKQQLRSSRLPSLRKVPQKYIVPMTDVALQAVNDNFTVIVNKTEMILL